MATVAIPQAHAQGDVTGMLRLSYTTPELLGDQTAEAISGIVPTDEQLRWQAYVPFSYDASRPPGVFVFVEPGDWGGLPDKWRDVIERSNLIWVGVDLTDRRTSRMKSIWAAILAARAIDVDYAVDLNRLYIGGLGDGAITAAGVMLSWGEFVGAVYMSGSFYWGNDVPEQIDGFRRKRHVFITGARDKAAATVRRDAESYRKDGVENVKLIYDPAGLRGGPGPEHIEEALRYLDSGR
jgi:hypothetical protein